MSEELSEVDLDKLYPEGNWIVMSGGLVGGYKSWGTFPTITDAIAWVRSVPIGPVSIMQIQSPDDFASKIKPNACNDCNLW